MSETVKLRIHHFFDILRDYGSGKVPEPHPYNHSFHTMAEKIYSDKAFSIELVLACDDVCRGCRKLEDGHCIDTIGHRKDFVLKEDFNNHIDRRIMTKMGLKLNNKYKSTEILDRAELYIRDIDWIYNGNDPAHTESRRKNVSKAILQMHRIQ